MTPRDKRQRLVIIVAILVALVGSALIFNSQKNNDDTSTVSEVTMKYPAGWVEQELSLGDRAQNVILRASRNTPQALFVARSLDIPVDKDFDITTLPSQLEAKYKKEFTGYKTISSKITKLGIYDSVQIRYTRLASTQTVEELRITVPTQDTTYYLILSSGNQSFSKVRAELMEVTRAFAELIDSNK